MHAARTEVREYNVKDILFERRRRAEVVKMICFDRVRTSVSLRRESNHNEGIDTELESTGSTGKVEIIELDNDDIGDQIENSEDVVRTDIREVNNEVVTRYGRREKKNGRGKMGKVNKRKRRMVCIGDFKLFEAGARGISVGRRPEIDT